MNKAGLIAHIADITSLQATVTGQVVDAVFEAITAALAKGEDVTVTGFGSFSVTDRPAREGRNPRTGEPVAIAASRAVKFKAGKGLKAGVQG